MKNSIIAAAVLFAIATPVSYADLILGAKVGPMLVSFDDNETSSDPTNVGLTLGYDFPLRSGIIGFEAEITRSVESGEVNGTLLDVESQGIYASYSTTGPIYFKAKIGIMDASLVAGDLSEDEGGETYGLGVGYRINNIKLELEYTSIDDDVAFISFGIVY